MPSLAEINVQPNSSLTADEKAFVRNILGISNISSDLDFVNSEARFGAMIPFEKKLVRHWLLVYGDAGDDNDLLKNSGLSVASEDTRERAVRGLYSLVYPEKDFITDKINLLNTAKSSISAVNAVYSDYLDAEREY